MRRKGVNISLKEYLKVGASLIHCGGCYRIGGSLGGLSLFGFKLF